MIRLYVCLITILFADDTPSKLVSCGVCELLGLSIRQHSSSEPLVVLLCACINKLVMFDIDQSGGSLGSQDKLAENFVCEMLIGKVLPLKLNPSIQSASAAVRAVGSLARRHSNNSDRLGACNACEAVMELCINPYLEDAQFAASICWCFANLSFPNEENQDKLGNSGACEVVLNILNQYGENTEIVQEGCRAMHQLAEFHDENLARFYEGNGFSVCNELIYKFNTRDDVLQWIMYALSTLVEHLEDLKKIHEVGLIDKIVELLSR